MGSDLYLSQGDHPGNNERERLIKRIAELEQAIRRLTNRDLPIAGVDMPPRLSEDPDWTPADVIHQYERSLRRIVGQRHRGDPVRAGLRRRGAEMAYTALLRDHRLDPSEPCVIVSIYSYG